MTDGYFLAYTYKYFCELKFTLVVLNITILIIMLTQMRCATVYYTNLTKPMIWYWYHQICKQTKHNYNKHLLFIVLSDWSFLPLLNVKYYAIMYYHVYYYRKLRSFTLVRTCIREYQAARHLKITTTSPFNTKIK